MRWPACASRPYTSSEVSTSSRPISIKEVTSESKVIMDTTVALTALPSKAALVNAFVGKKVSSLRTPAFVVNKAIVTKNCAEMQKNASKWGARFRAHIKTHKVSHPRIETSPLE